MDVLAGGVRLAIAAIVLVLLARIVPVAWRNRIVALHVWRSIRVRHVVGSLGLLVLVVGTAVGLYLVVPGADFGLGRLIGLTGNAIFAPIAEATSGPGAGGGGGGGSGSGGGPGALAVVATGAFLVALLALFPWLAYVEERTFREGLEDASLGRQVTSAARFGLIHLVMLIPLAAAAAIGVAGFVYGITYRRAFRRAQRRETTVTAGPWGVPIVVRPSTAALRTEGVLAATVWHATFNSLIVVLVMVGLALDWLL